MQTRFLLPALGGILGILLARSQGSSALETFAVMILGLAAGYGIYWLTSRNSRGGT